MHSVKRSLPFPLISQPQRVGPAPAVLRSIRAEIKTRKLSPQDRRMALVASELAAEPVVHPGLNEGIFYPPNALPAGIAGLNLSPSAAVRRRATTGPQRLLVLLVDFSDNPGTRAASEYQEMLFSQGTYPTGSMKDFYLENSYNKLTIDGTVIGWLRLPKTYADYVSGQSGTGPYPGNAQKMVEDALALAAQQVDFSQYDADGDGYLDGLFVVHAGTGAEADPNTATRGQKIWSHQFNITQPFTSHGITAYSYLTVPEDCLVGVCCHEFGHMLGLPDLYDTTYASEGVGVWCVMGAGSWNNGGKTPSHFCAWSKARLKWLSPNNVKTARTLQLPAVENDATAVYRLWTDGKAGSEYFLIENRQQVGFDAKQPGTGLLIWRIDDSQTSNTHPGNYWVGLMQADGKRDLESGRNRGDADDPYPGGGKNTSFTKTSNPNSSDKFGNPTGVSITKVAEKSGAITCRAKV